MTLAGEKPKPVSTLIHRLPVTEHFTCAAGRGIWGFPKWIADLSVDFDDRGATCVLREGDTDVVRITMRRGRIPLPRRPMPMNAFSCDEAGVVRRTAWGTNGTGRQTVRPGGTTVEIGYGIVSDLECEAIRLMARHEGILLDPVYAGRAFGALVDSIRIGVFKRGETVLFWHTGGYHAIFDPTYTQQIWSNLPRLRDIRL